MLLLKRAPFIKLILPLIAGILLQWQYRFSLPAILYCGISITGFLFIYSFIPLSNQFYLKTVTGIAILGLTIATGCLSVYLSDVRNHHSWFGKLNLKNTGMLAKLEEPLSAKPKSYKSIASVFKLTDGVLTKDVSGKIILYFKKDTLLPALMYGSVIAFSKPPEPIQNSGNPGAFDYAGYCLFREITHQVFLAPGEFQVTSSDKGSLLQSFLFKTRDNIIDILRKYIHGKREQALAEALLIGYKNDLDKTLIQSFSNTGVVHIIAISGLHLGVLYGLLILLLKPFKKRQQTKWLRAVLLITGIWLFTLLTGGAPSVTRSAVMFSAVILSEVLNRKSSIYNTLAFSAFILLCYNPFWLWDAGFQLSYAAVLSIIVFYRKIYTLLDIKNRLLDFFWKINSVTLAAQVLTIPLGIYHFHQFPNYFLLTNFLLVPLSGLVLTGELSLCLLSFYPPLAGPPGNLLSKLLHFMNIWVERINTLPFSVWESLYLSQVQTLLLYLIIAGLSYWLSEKNKMGLKAALTAMLMFTVLRTLSVYSHTAEKKIIVYNIPQHEAIDLCDPAGFQFIGDTELHQDDFRYAFYIKPSRVLNRLSRPAQLVPHVNGYFSFSGKKIMLLDQPRHFKPDTVRPRIDLLIVSNNSPVHFPALTQTFDIAQVVFDGSNTYRKLVYWKKDCDSLHIPWYDVSEKGAFVMTLN